MRGMTLRAMAKACNGKYYGSEAWSVYSYMR